MPKNSVNIFKKSKDVVAVSIILNPKTIPSLILTTEQVNDLVKCGIEKDKLTVRTTKLVSGGSTKTNWNTTRRRGGEYIDLPYEEIGITRLWVFISVDSDIIDKAINDQGGIDSFRHNAVEISFTRQTEINIDRVELRGDDADGIIIYPSQNMYVLASPMAYGNKILERFIDIALKQDTGFFRNKVNEVYGATIIADITQAKNASRNLARLKQLEFYENINIHLVGYMLSDSKYRISKESAKSFLETFSDISAEKQCILENNSQEQGNNIIDDKPLNSALFTSEERDTSKTKSVSSQKTSYNKSSFFNRFLSKLSSSTSEESFDEMSERSNPHNNIS